MIGSLNKEALPKYLGALPLSYKKWVKSSGSIYEM
jgi:hypothetical protein